MPSLTIDNRKIQVPGGTNLLEAARMAGIKIPSLCYLRNVQAIGSCRVCLVEVKGAKALMPSCVTLAGEGMEVQTNSPRARNARRTMVELILSDHEGDCQTCDRSADCELQAIASDLGIREISFAGSKSKRMTDASTPALVRDTAKCVSCPALRDRVRRDAGSGGHLPAGEGLQFEHRAGVRESALRRGVRAVRAVRRGVPRGRHLRARRDRSGVGGPG